MTEKKGFFSKFVRSRRKSSEQKCNVYPTGAAKGNGQIRQKFHRFPVRPASQTEESRRSSGDITVPAAILDLNQAFEGEFPTRINIWRQDLPGYTANPEGHADKVMTAPELGETSEGATNKSRYQEWHDLSAIRSHGGLDTTNFSGQKPDLASGIAETYRRDEPPAGSTNGHKPKTEMETFLSSTFEGIRGELLMAVNGKERSRLRNRIRLSSSSKKQVSQSSVVQGRDTQTTKAMESGATLLRSPRDAAQGLVSCAVAREPRPRDVGGPTSRDRGSQAAAQETTQGQATEDKALPITEKFAYKTSESIPAWRRSDIPFSYIPRNMNRRTDDDILDLRSTAMKKPAVAFSDPRAMDDRPRTSDELFLDDLCDELESDRTQAWCFDSSSASSASLATQESLCNWWPKDMWGSGCSSLCLTLFTPKPSDQYEISPEASPEILHHKLWRTWLFIAYSDERWLYYQFSLPLYFLNF